MEKNALDQKKAMGVMIVGGILAFTFFCAVCCGRESLKTAIDCIDAAADFLRKTKRVIAVPFFFFLLQILAISIWLPCMAYVTSMNHVAPSDTMPQIKDITWDPKVKIMALYMFFGILWVCAFFEYCSTFVVMVSTSTYYWSSNSMAEGDGDVALGFSYCFVHFGSLAIGSFIIALIRFIRITFMYAAQQAEKSSGDNAGVKAIVRCAECILACIEKICDYINDSAYAYQAVTGDSFCASAWSAFMLQLRHMLKFSFAQLIAKIFILLGKVGITAGNMVSCYYIMKLVFKDMEGDLEATPIDPPITQAYASVALVGVFSYMVASIFLGLLDTAVLSLLTCVAIDLDRNDGVLSTEHGPPTFHDGGLDKYDTADQHAKNREFEDAEGGQREELGYESFRESWIFKAMQ